VPELEELGATMNVSEVAAVITSTDRDASVRDLTALLGGPQAVFPVPVADLTVTVFAGVSVISGRGEAIEPVRDLRASVFVDSLIEAETMLGQLGWAKAGSLGSASLLARDTQGNLLEFVERHPS
jgi:hypothetical protein